MKTILFLLALAGAVLLAFNRAQFGDTHEDVAAAVARPVVAVPVPVEPVQRERESMRVRSRLPDGTVVEHDRRVSGMRSVGL